MLIIAIVVGVILAAVAGFIYVLYRIGKEMHMYRCGHSKRDF